MTLTKIGASLGGGADTILAAGGVQGVARDSERGLLGALSE